MVIYILHGALMLSFYIDEGLVIFYCFNVYIYITYTYLITTAFFDIMAVDHMATQIP